MYVQCENIEEGSYRSNLVATLVIDLYILACKGPVCFHLVQAETASSLVIPNLNKEYHFLSREVPW